MNSRLAATLLSLATLSASVANAQTDNNKHDHSKDGPAVSAGTSRQAAPRGGFAGAYNAGSQNYGSRVVQSNQIAQSRFVQTQTNTTSARIDARVHSARSTYPGNPQVRSVVSSAPAIASSPRNRGGQLAGTTVAQSQGLPIAAVGGPSGRQFSYRGHQHAQVRVAVFSYPSGYGYRRWNDGQRLPMLFLTDAYYFGSFAEYGFGAPPYGERWVRYGPDLLLVNMYTGRIDDVIYGVFYD